MTTTSVGHQRGSQRHLSFPSAPARGILVFSAYLRRISLLEHTLIDRIRVVREIAGSELQALPLTGVIVPEAPRSLVCARTRQTAPGGRSGGPLSFSWE